MKFIEKLSKNKKFEQRVGEILILLLDRFEDIEKSTLLSKLFASYIKNEISFDEFHHLAKALDQCLLNDLKRLPYFFNKPESLSVLDKDNLYRAELLKLRNYPNIGFGKMSYELNVYGEKILENYI